MTEGERRALAEVGALYARLEGGTTELGECRACGRCCHFKEYGHRLYATYVEALYLVEKDGRPNGHFDENSCGYQKEHLCEAREGRPLGCRTFFCGADTAEARRVHEDALQEIRRITTRHALEWDYRPIGEHVARLCGSVLPEVLSR